MQNTPARSAEETEDIVRKYGNMLFRICFVMLGNENDAEDAVQDTILKYMQKAPSFDGPEHEKAWLIKVASNRCRDMKRFWLRHPHSDIADLQNYISEPQSCGIIETLILIPEKYRIVLTLYYVEEYRVKEIAGIIGKSVSAVKMRLQKGRRLLEEKYREECL